MIVVSDTSAISNLIAIGRENLLWQLFGEVIIPEAVRVELQRVHGAIPDFVSVRRVRNVAAVHALRATPLDEGESEAITIAEELSADYLLIDEKAGRAVATERKLQIIGVLGVLGRAKEAGLLASVGPELEKLTCDFKFWISPSLRRSFLSDMGEA